MLFVAIGCLSALQFGRGGAVVSTRDAKSNIPVTIVGTMHHNPASAALAASSELTQLNLNPQVKEQEMEKSAAVSRENCER